MASLLSYSLTNLADVKESLGIAASDGTWDNLCIRKINQATRAIEAYCGRRFTSTVYTNEYYSATQVDELVLRQRPVISFTSLDIRDSGLNYDNWETIDSQLYFVDNNSGVVKLMFNALGRWDRYRVTYTAGYATIPEDLAEACASLAAYYVTFADGSHIGLSEKSEGSRKLAYGRNNNLLNFVTIMAELGLDEVINSYTNFPVMNDR